MRTTVLGLATLSGLSGLSATSLVACGTDFTQDPAPDAPAPRATWYQDVAPIVSSHCMSCHQTGGIAPFTLTAFEDARDNAARMMTQIHAGTMPPFNASEQPDCTPRFGWKDDPRLSAAEIQTIQTWIDDGLAPGTVADVPKPANTDLPGVTQTLSPVLPWTSSGDHDQFICTVLDPNTTGAWLTGLQVRPGNPTVVHHVVVTELQPGAEHDATIAAHGIGMPWDCSTQTTPGSLVVSIWTPGNQPMQTPADLAVPVISGSKLVMQIHYHPAGKVNAADATSLDLRTSLQWPKKMYFIGAFGNASAAPQLLADPDDRTLTPEFRIPANKADHSEHMQFVVPDLGGLTDVRLYSVNPHMHLIGTHINSTITRVAPTATQPAQECLANGAWNFDWQRTYLYDAALDQLPLVQAGDTLDIQCHWNNTMANPFEQRALVDAGLVAPIDVSLGEGQSTDEMCLEIFGLAVDAPPAPARVRPPIAADLPAHVIGALAGKR